MTGDVYRYRFGPRVPIDQVEATLVLAVLATESLHGESQVALDAGHAWDANERICIVDARTPVGRSLNQLFIGFARREFGDAAFRVERIDESHLPLQEVA